MPGEDHTERPAQRVLVVDDNAVNRQLATAHLRAAGYGVALASTGAEALEAFANAPADLVLLDIVMPDLDGFETCKRLRALPGGQDTPIVFLTALSDDAAHERAL